MTNSRKKTKPSVGKRPAGKPLAANKPSRRPQAKRPKPRPESVENQELTTTDTGSADGVEGANGVAEGPKTDKIQKLLANAGMGSRREMEKALSEGRVKVNGEVAKLGDRATSKDELKLDGRTLKRNDGRPTRRILVYNKPEGEICSVKDPEGRPTVFNKLPKLKGERWINVGRLDINTSGLLLFTNDGELANLLMHPSSEIEREYAVRVLGEVNIDMINRMHEGVELEDGLARFTDIQEFGGSGANVWYHVVVMEGRNREVRRLWESQGVQVSRLKRVRYGNVFMEPELRAGTWREMDRKEVNLVAQSVGLPPKAWASLFTKDAAGERLKKKAEKQRTRRHA